ncbi:MAG TPA: PAS domain S-box protein [Ktedonobacterales bacterium]|nr:PAS domain S-box protein [Ktedonobacterales bacterium]
MKDAQSRVDPRLSLKGPRHGLSRLWTATNGRRVLLLLMFAVAYAVISRHQTLPPALDPAGALLLASCLLLPPRRWWPYLLVATAVQVWILASLSLPALAGLLIWAANLTEPIVIVYLIRRAGLFETSHTHITNMRVVSSYAACVLVGATISASLAAIGLSATGRPFGASWWSWFLSVCLNALVLAPTIALWAMSDYRDLLAASGRRVIETVLVFGALALVGFLVFDSHLQGQYEALAPILIYFPVPLLLWVAARFDLRATLTALSLTCVLAVIGVMQRAGPFISLSDRDSRLALQAYLLVIVVPLVLVVTLLEERAQALSKKHVSDKRYRAFFALNAVGAAQADPYEGRLLSVNEAFCRITGYTREALLGMPFSAITHPEDREANFEEFQSLVRGDIQQFSTQKRYIRADGQTIWAQVDATMLRDEKGKPLHSLTIIQDITERKQTEEALRLSEARYRTAFESAATGMMLVSLDGHSLRVNRPLIDMLGYSEEEFRTGKFEDFTYPDDLDSNMDLYQQALAGKIDSYQLEKRVIHKRGHVVWGLLSAGLVRDDAGNPLYFVGQIQDITERRRATEELKASEERFRLMADTAPVMIWVAGPDGLVTFFNIPWLRFTGRALDQELRDGWAEGVHPDDRSRCLSTYRTALHARRDFTMEYRLRRFDGEYRWLVESGVPRYSPDGTFLGYIGSAIDITEHRQAEEQLDRLSAQLLRTQDNERQRIARELHDSTVQTISAVKLNLGRLRRRLGSDGSSGGKFADVLDEGEELMDQAATELRTLSYLLHPPMLDDIGLAAAISWYAEGFARRSGLRIELEAPTDLGRLPAQVETSLYRIVQEALSNVHLHSGSKSARIRLHQRGNAIWLRIQDRGKGMPAAIAQNGAGGSSSALSSASDGSAGAAGLGVGIAGMRQRLRQLGGRLEIRSTSHGTTITAVAPLGKLPARESALEDEQSDDDVIGTA